jgi:hypothetical protein
MAFFKIGDKDRGGRQKRIEHTGPYLRVSRTGGVSLRAQTRIAGVNATANTRHGLRLSTRLAKNTQVAMQNGRFVLRGRYGSDAAKLNLSRSGVTVSTRTPSGTLNWIKPGRSSFKLAGVQVRGHKAVWLQLAHLLVMVVVGAVQWVLQIVLSLLLLLRRLVVASAQWVQSRRAQAAQDSLLAALDTRHAEALAGRWLSAQSMAFAAESQRSVLAALGYCLVCLGRGDLSLDPQRHGHSRDAGAAQYALMTDMAAAGRRFQDRLPGSSDPDFPLLALGLMLQLAESLAVHLVGDACEETLLALDDACLAGGPKTVLQEAMIDALAARWNARLVVQGEA